MEYIGLSNLDIKDYVERLLDITTYVKKRNSELGLVDKQGDSLSEHTLRVANTFDFDTAEHLVALLHDTLEDGIYTKEQIFDIFKDDALSGSVIINSLFAITKKDGESYKEYIERVSKDVIATNVKIADLIDNMRFSDDENYRSRNERYRQALKFLVRKQIFGNIDYGYLQRNN